MKMLSFYDIDSVIDECIKQEKELCANYMKNNPTDKRRERIKEDIISGMRTVWFRLYEMAKENNA